MATYEVTFKRSAEKDLRKLPRKAIARVLAIIEKLQTEPRPLQSKSLRGAEHLHRVRVGEYRIIYSLEDRECRVIIHYVRHRRDIYRQL